MPFYTQEGKFDIHERNDKKFDVILMPNTDFGCGKTLATFDNRKDAEHYCIDWKPEQKN